MIQALPGLRKGQTLFNFLEFIRVKKGIPVKPVDGHGQSARMFDPFNISDDELEALWVQFAAEAGVEFISTRPSQERNIPITRHEDGTHTVHDMGQ